MVSDNPSQTDELEREQAYIDRAHECLAAARKTARELRTVVESNKGGTHQARFERDVIEGKVQRRLDHLELGDKSLCFGRIDTEDDSSYYIGRIGVWDENRNPVIVDWRAPVAEPFYRATGPEPMSLRRRRHFASLGRRLLRIEDEYFATGNSEQAWPTDFTHSGGTDGSPAGDEADNTTIRDSAGRSIRGLGAVRQALAEARTGKLSDIVATIQAEQDEVVRSPQHGVLVVQGGPGTGKTVVALHRAAYLLYTHRFPLERQGVLIAAPNRLFANYIEIVLPSLGEAGAVVATPGEMLGMSDVTIKGYDPEEVAVIKGDKRMAKLIKRAIRDRQRPLREDFTVPFRPEFRLTVEQSKQLIAEVRSKRLPHNTARKFLITGFFQRLHEGEQKHRESINPNEYSDAQGVREEIGDFPEVKEALAWMWPTLSPRQLLFDLFSVPSLLRSAGKKDFSEQELELLRIPRKSRKEWSAEDVPLLDEAQWLLGKTKQDKAAEEAGSQGGTRGGQHGGQHSGMRTYGHVVIDEAQDISPMQLRMLTRRSLNGSMTLVGDIAQATSALSGSSWEELLEQLPSKWQSRQSELSVGYRLPKPIASYASCLLNQFAPDLSMPVAVQEDGAPPETIHAEDLFEGLTQAVKDAIATTEEAETIAVITPDNMAETCAEALETAGINSSTAYDGALSTKVSVLPVRYVKGLEVDVGIVVEPTVIATQSRRGPQSLYVALTRAMRKLVVLHSEPLPKGLSLETAS